MVTKSTKKTAKKAKRLLSQIVRMRMPLRLKMMKIWYFLHLLINTSKIIHSDCQTLKEIERAWTTQIYIDHMMGRKIKSQGKK